MADAPPPNFGNLPHLRKLHNFGRNILHVSFTKEINQNTTFHPVLIMLLVTCELIFRNE